jgi:hypothetical protein
LFDDLTASRINDEILSHSTITSSRSLCGE